MVSSSMDNLLIKSLVVFTLLFVSASAARPRVVSHYSGYPGNPGGGRGGGGPVDPNPPKPINPRPDPRKPNPGDEERKPIENEGFIGSWELHSENAGVSAMHIQLLPNNKAVWYDSTGNGVSAIESNPRVCRERMGGNPETEPPEDCTAHAIEYDIETAEIRTLQMKTNPWCSSGGLSINGALVSTGGVFNGFRSVRIFKPCPNCDFEEKKNALLALRWYATTHRLEDGSFILIGGSHAQNYEIIPAESLNFKPQMFAMPFLNETDYAPGENNLYPFVNLLPNGNLFVFANSKSIILDPITGEEVHRYPDLDGGVRNYPPSAMSALLPIDLRKVYDDNVDLEVIICGGNSFDSFYYSDRVRPREFLPALEDCGRLVITRKGEKWKKEYMPSPRVMGDMLVLPTGDLLLINGAKAGTSAWNAADIPNLTPVLYSPNKPKGERFMELAPTTIPRMYHSVSAVLPDGKILIAGSNTNAWYMREAPAPNLNMEFKYPTELRVEKFSPPYLAPELQKYRLEIIEEGSTKDWSYGGEFLLRVKFANNEGEGEIDTSEVKVTMYSPPFTTHGTSMNQRLLILKLKKVSTSGKIKVMSPPTASLAPPGYYLVFVVHRDVPSRGMWVQIL